MDYLTLKTLHVTLALVSVSWFIVRAIPAIWLDRPWTRNRVLYSLPHAVDTALVVTGIWLALMVGWRPLAHPWLGFKLALLVVYIGLGWSALRPRLGEGWRVALFLLALTVFFWMLLVARTKSALGPLALL